MSRLHLVAWLAVAAWTSACGAQASAAAAAPVDVAAAGADAGDLADVAVDAAPDTAPAPVPDSGSGSDSVADSAAADVPAPKPKAGTYPLTLDAGAFAPTPGHPSAVVVIPPGFDATPPLAVIVYIHGWSNCVANVVGSKDSACKPGGAVEGSSHLADQLAAAKKNAILLCPEVAFDAATGDPGNLGKKDGFAALLSETLTKMAPVLGKLTLADVGRVVVMTHSGGYQAAASIATQGGVPVQELYLLDSLYGSIGSFEGWIQTDLASFEGAMSARRFGDVYTQNGGTLANSQALATKVATWLPAASTALYSDKTASTWPPATYQHGLLFKFSALSHHGTTLYYFGQFVAASGLPPLP